MKMVGDLNGASKDCDQKSLITDKKCRIISDPAFDFLNLISFFMVCEVDHYKRQASSYFLLLLVKGFQETQPCHK
jgi:hypothetical protein